jgi:NADPH:quinone reductase-like Zn-dependent oxidoreductase
MTTVMSQMPKPRSGSFNSAVEQHADGKRDRTMKAIYLQRRGGVEALVAGEIQRPGAKEGEVLVRVYATSVMPTELEWFTTFNLPFGEPRPFPIVLSHEFSGVVESVGAKVNGFSVGDEVFGLNDWFTNGAQAEYCIVKGTGLARRPKSLVHVQSAVVPISALTAWQGLFERGKLERGQRVLIHGAAGGVGSFAVQLAHRRGAHVIASVSSGSLGFARFLGADEVIDYRTTRFEEVVKDVDVVFDCVGGETLERSWGLLATGGRMVTVSTTSEKSTERHARDAFMLVRADGSQLAEIANLIEAGDLQVFVGTIFPLTAARLAYARARQGLRRGKVALRIAE